MAVELLISFIHLKREVSVSLILKTPQPCDEKSQICELIAISEQIK